MKDTNNLLSYIEAFFLNVDFDTIWWTFINFRPFDYNLLHRKIRQ
jgi:hypothetical protein